MSRIILLAMATVLFAFAALAQRAPLYDSPSETRAAMREALAERDEARRRSERLEQQAQAAEDAAGRAAREAAALAARIQQAESGIAAAEARIGLAETERAELREELGREQQPVVQLTAALQQFSRRPAALAVFQPGSIEDVVHVRAVLASAAPVVEARTADLRWRIARSRQLQRETEQAAQVLREEEARLAARRRELAEIETRQRIAARQAGGTANREAERALALAEQARDLDSLMGELDRAANLRQELAALPGPRRRPESQAATELAASPAPSPSAVSTAVEPSPYILPVAGRTVTGFGAPVGAGLSQGLTLAPRSGALVVAPAAGRVVFAGPYRGYGQIVIIEHGDGWTSLVTGLARSDVEAGEDLVGGAPIGVAGSGRPTVSLELRHRGEAVNPLELAG